MKFTNAFLWRVEGEPVQVIEPELRIELPVEDLSAVEERERRVEEELRREASEPFDLSRGRCCE